MHDKTFLETVSPDTVGQFALVNLRRQKEVPAIVIGFGRDTITLLPNERKEIVGEIIAPPTDSIAAQHIFRVDVEPAIKNPFRCFCELIGEVVPVSSITVGTSPTFGTSPVILRATEAEPGKGAIGLAFIVDDVQKKALISTFRVFEGRFNAAHVRITLLGDHVIEFSADKTKPARAIDAEFVRSELPTGDRPKTSTTGIQGGTFHSWFWLGNRFDHSVTPPSANVTP